MNSVFYINISAVISRVANHNQQEGHQQTEEGHRAAEDVNGVGCGEGVSPPHRGEVWGAMPLRRKF